MSCDPPLPGFDDHAPPDRFCDLILTGGVTSAVAYPPAIFALASAYRFHAIGGSSSGAGAAALAAAAEYRRRHGSGDGFRILLERIAAIAESADGKTGLEWLFQPRADFSRLFSMLVPLVARPSPGLGKQRPAGLGRVPGVFLRAYWCPVLLGGLLAASLTALLDTWTGQAVWSHPFLFVLGISVTGFAMGVLVLLIDLLSAVRADYGLCDGLNPTLDTTRHKPITGWLHELIQAIAGRPDDQPLTFSDLKRAPGAPGDLRGAFASGDASSIDLRMFAANVTHGRPVVFPTGEDDPPLYFRPSELAALFPPAVVEHMKAHSPGPLAKPKNVVESARQPLPWWQRSLTRVRLPPDGGPEEHVLWRLPSDQLPIVVAARMSVSFPVLFTAVPLWAEDPQDQTVRRCLFSDGGLCANFPIHLFDSLLPAWPTFGISIYDLPDGEPGYKVSLPQRHQDGGDDRRDAFDDKPAAGSRLSGFVGALLSTTKDWNDTTLARLPGVRDRVARVGLSQGLGGLNILMTGENIRTLARAGRDAALLLLERFSQASSSSGHAQGWNEHRWVRFNLLRDGLARSLNGLTGSAAQARYAQPLRQQIHAAREHPPLEGDKEPTLLAAQAAELEGALDLLIKAERLLNSPGARQPYQPSPRPELRVRPPL